MSFSKSNPGVAKGYKDDPNDSRELKVYPIYSAPVRIGNWNDDLALEEEKIRVAKYKSANCQLLVQRTRKMFSNLLKPVALAKQSPYVQFGLTYQIKACDLPNKLEPEEGYKKMYGLYLSGLMNERDIDLGTHFLHGCGITASPDRAPCVRNTFIFSGCNGQSDGQSLAYGEDVHIRIYESDVDGYLFLQCENSTYDDFGGHLSLRLTQSPDLYCRFKVYHWNPLYRYDTERSGCAPNTRVIIQHTASGRNMAAEYGNFMPTFFGAECIVSCHTFRDSHKMETAENMWQIVSETIPDISLFVRAAKGEEIPLDLL